MSRPKVERVCVVGAGSAGLTAIKNCLEYGLQVTCFEKTTGIGGIWRYKDDEAKGLGTVMRSTMLNTSKEFISFSDYPLPDDASNFMHNTEVYRFLRSYAEHFKLLDCIQFRTDVVLIERSQDYVTTGKWTVETKNVEGDHYVHTFDAVMLCEGHHVWPNLPFFQGLDFFQGRALHSHDYREPSKFANRRVLVVGLGNSGGDIMCELSKVAKKVYGSSRYGTWTTQRVRFRGYPRDVMARTRVEQWIAKKRPTWLNQWLAMRDSDDRLDHELHGLRPTEKPGASPVLLADDLAQCLASGTLELRVGINHFSKNAVHYEDGRSDEIDDVILCTGYSWDLRLVEQGRLIPCDDNQTRLYRRIFSPNTTPHHTLAIIGLVDPLGPTITISEMQSRAVAHLWANGVALPSKQDMERHIDADKIATRKRFACSARRASLQIDYSDYLDLLATWIGANPPRLTFHLLNQDPLLFSALAFFPISAHQYRLTGPNPWIGARHQLITAYDRIHLGMNSRRREELRLRLKAEPVDRRLVRTLLREIPAFRSLVALLISFVLVLAAIQSHALATVLLSLALFVACTLVFGRLI